MTRVNLEAKISNNKDDARRLRNFKGPDRDLERLIEEQKTELNIFDDVWKNFSRDLIKDGLIANKRITAEEAESKFRNLSANEMHDLVRKYSVEYYLSEQNRGAKDVYLSELDMRDGKRKYEIKDLLKSALNL